jgi:hypothetical protein
MSDDVERVAEALAAAVRMPHTAACPCGPFAVCECPTRERALEAAQVLLAPGGVVAGMVAEERAGAADESSGDYRIVQVTQVQRTLDAAREAGAAEVRARVEAVLPECWTFARAESCRSMIGGTFPNGTKWTADMCCLPCQLRAALADPGTAAPATEPATK